MKKAGQRTLQGSSVLWLLVRTWVIGLFVLSTAFHGAVVASPAPRLYVPPIPEDLGAVDLYLLTAGVGDEIANRFGHTGIRILDRRSGSDVVFNWGKFHFDAPGFAWKFFRGSLVYSMGVRTFQNDTSIYEESGRRLVMDRLNLTAAQKLRLIEKIRWNAMPENRDFAYQYWYKNCATIPRDYLDAVLDGQIAARFAPQPAGRVFRDYVRSNLAYVAFVVPLLDTLMNGNIDRGISLWEDMFLPSRLREVLREMPAVDDRGQPVEGERLLVEESVIVDVPEAFAAALPDYLLLVLPAWLSLLVPGFSIGFGRWASTKARAQRGVRWGGFGRKALGVGTIYWGFLSGVVGSTLALNWAFSGHPDGWGNANLLFIWPSDLCLIPLGWRLLKGGETVKDRWPWAGAGGAYIIAKTLGVLILVAGYKVQVIHQDVSRVVLAFGLPTLAILWANMFWGLADKRLLREAEGGSRGSFDPNGVTPSASLREL